MVYAVAVAAVLLGFFRFSSHVEMANILCVGLITLLTHVNNGFECQWNIVQSP